MLFGLVAVGMLWTCGCGERTGDRQKISGTVRLKGQLLDQGRIDFFHSEKATTTAAADIENGQYSIPAAKGLSPGTYRVVISSMSGKVPPSDQPPGEAPEYKERIPAKYNEESQLTKEVKAGAENVFDFTLD